MKRDVVEAGARSSPALGSTRDRVEERRGCRILPLAASEEAPTSRPSHTPLGDQRHQTVVIDRAEVGDVSPEDEALASFEDVTVTIAAMPF
jgi:hypothetical protein